MQGLTAIAETDLRTRMDTTWAKPFTFPVNFQLICSFPGTLDPQRGHASEMALHPAIVQSEFFKLTLTEPFVSGCGLGIQHEDE